jgi:dihydrofolate reductase
VGEEDLAEDPMWGSRMSGIDTILLGRITYEKWVGFWPSQLNNPDAPRFEKAFAAFANDARKVIFSKTLRSASWRNTIIVSGDVGEEVRRLKSLPGKNIALAGPRLAQSFIERGLVDEMLLEIFPSILGKGIPLFKVEPNPDNPEDHVPMGVPGRQDFKLLEAKPLKDGTVFLHYSQ